MYGSNELLIKSVAGRSSTLLSTVFIEVAAISPFVSRLLIRFTSDVMSTYKPAVSLKVEGPRIGITKYGPSGTPQNPRV